MKWTEMDFKKNQEGHLFCLLFVLPFNSFSTIVCPLISFIWCECEYDTNRFFCRGEHLIFKMGCGLLCRSIRISKRRKINKVKIRFKVFF